jgi:asparagine synthase (glutamine-hydrolysing)
MCGITSIISPDRKDHVLLEEMTGLLRHRGPDSHGYWRGGTVSLGHRRLAILDLSEAGNQPMHGRDGMTHLVCNGEVYNYKEKNELLRSKGYVIRSGSDSETLLHLYDEFGEQFIEHANGMFAFALWDERTETLTAGVDRFGKKPLYYAYTSDKIILASELKSLLLFDWVDRRLNMEAVDRYLAFRYVPAPLTMFKGIRKLTQGTILTWRRGELRERTYWAPSLGEPILKSNTAQQDYRDLLFDSVRIRLQSDVPLGVYLSGGVDSAAVAAIMAGLGAAGSASFTLCVPYAHDERSRAQRIAKHLGFEFNPVEVAGDDFGLINTISYHLDEPLGDLIAIPSYLLAKEARKKLTVVLTGDGADEVLTGYFHQRIMAKWHNARMAMALPGMGRILSGLLSAVPLGVLNAFFDYPDRIGPREKHKLAEALANCKTFGAFYEGLTACFSHADKQRLYSDSALRGCLADPVGASIQRDFDSTGGGSILSRLSMLDLKYWIPFIVLFRLDKLNMANALETRSPFLDYRLVQMSLNLSPDFKLTTNSNKVVLREVLRELYPPLLREKGKQAFYMPVTQSLRPSFLAWIGGLTGRDAVVRRGLFDPDFVETLHLSARQGSMLANRQLTALAMLESWFRVFVDGGGAPPVEV